MSNVPNYHLCHLLRLLRDALYWLLSLIRLLGAEILALLRTGHSNAKRASQLIFTASFNRHIPIRYSRTLIKNVPKRSAYTFLNVEN